MFRPLSRLLPAAVAGLLFSLALGAPATAAAADPADDTITWMVRPSDGVGEDGRSWIELTLDPGATVEEHLLIRNLSRETVTFQLSAADGYFTDTGRFNMLTSSEPSVGAGTWIDMRESVEVASGADVIVPFTLTVPDNATPGDHPAGVAAAIRSGSDEQVGIESRVGFRVMTRVTGELAPSADIEVSGSYLGSWNPFEPGRLDVGYTVSNTGNTRLSVVPRVTATALFGLVSFSVDGEDIVEIAPGESRSQTASFAQAWPLGVFSVEATAVVTPVGDDLAAAAIAPVTATTAVAAIPWSQLVTIAIGALLLWLLWRERHRRDRKLAAIVEAARQEGREEAAQPPVTSGV